MKRVQLFGLASLMLTIAVFQAEVFAWNCTFIFNPYVVCSQVFGNVYCENNVADGFAEQECREVCDDLSLPYVDFDCDDGPESDVLTCSCLFQ